MMNLGQMLTNSGAIDSIARELGVDAQTARAGAGALLPAIVAGMGRSATEGSSQGGLGGLGSLAGAILGGGGVGMLDAILGNGPTPVEQGNDVLGNIFGSRDVSRSVASEVAGATGLDETLLKRMLPLLAMAVTGYLARQGQQQSSSDAGSSPLGGLLGALVSGLATRS